MKTGSLLTLGCAALAFLLPCFAQTAVRANLQGIPLKDINGKASTLGVHSGKVLLIVNVASNSPWTPQYAALEALQKKYREKGFSILGFPCNDFDGGEPGTPEEIKTFSSKTYGVTFPLYEKLHVTGPEQHPLYAALTGKSSPVPGELKENFGKYLIGRDGAILKRWPAKVTPGTPEIAAAIEAALAKGRPATPGLLHASFFGVTSSGDNVIFCINVSGIMLDLVGREGVAALRRELKKAITALPAAMNFNLVCYAGSSADVFKPANIPASQDMKTEAIKFLEGYYGSNPDFSLTRTLRYGREGKDSAGIAYVPVLPEDIKELTGLEGGSRIDLAMAAAFMRSPVTLFVVCAGPPGTRKAGADKAMAATEVVELIQGACQALTDGKSRVTVNTFSFESIRFEAKEGKAFLRLLASKFGGKYLELKAPRLEAAPTK